MSSVGVPGRVICGIARLQLPGYLNAAAQRRPLEVGRQKLVCVPREPRFVCPNGERLTAEEEREEAKLLSSSCEKVVQVVAEWAQVLHK